MEDAGIGIRIFLTMFLIAGGVAGAGWFAVVAEAMSEVVDRLDGKKPGTNGERRRSDDPWKERSADRIRPKRAAAPWTAAVGGAMLTSWWVTTELTGPMPWPPPLPLGEALTALGIVGVTAILLKEREQWRWRRRQATGGTG